MQQYQRPPKIAISPGRPPFVPQIAVPDYLVPALPTVTANLIIEIQNGSDQNAQRSLLFDIMAYNGFYNDAFIRLVEGLFHMADYFVNICGSAPNDALAAAYQQTLQIKLASIACEYREIYDRMGPDERETVNALMAEMQRLKVDIERMMQMRGTGVGQLPNPGGGGYPQQMQQPYQPQGTPYSNQPIYSAPRAANPAARMAATVPTPMRSETRAGGSSGWDRPRTTVQPVAAPLPDPIPYNVPPPLPAAGVTNAGDMTFIQQSDTSKESWPLLAPGKYPTVIRYGEQVAFFTRSFKNDNIGVLISAIEDCTMEYRLHDNDRYLRPRLGEVARAKPNYTAGDKALADIAAQRDVEAMLQELESQQVSGEGLVLLAGEAINVPTPVLMNTDDDYHTVAVNAMGVPVDLETCTVSMTVMHFYNWDVTDPAVAKIVANMAKSKDYLDMRNWLYRLREAVPFYYWERLERDITRRFVSLCKVGLGIGLDIDSFGEDIDDAIAYMRDMGEEVFDVFNREMFFRLRDTGCAMATSDDLRKARNIPDDVPVNPCFGFYEDVTLLPVTSNDLALGCPSPVGGVNNFHNPALFAALSARMARKHPMSRYLRFITLDNQTFWVHECFLNSTLVVSLEEI